MTADCAFEELLPSRKCPLPGMKVELVMAFLNATMGPGSRLRVIRSEMWSFRPGLPGGSDNTSALGQVEAGLADLTFTDFALSAERSVRLEWAGPLLGDRVRLLWRRHSLPRGGLLVGELLGRPLLLWLLLSVALASGAAFGRLTRRLPLTRCPRLSLQLSLVLVNLALSLLSNYICIVFVASPAPSAAFDSLASLEPALLSGEYELVAWSALLKRELAEKEAELYAKLVAAGRLRRRHEGLLGRLEREAAASRPKLVFLVYESDIEHGVFRALNHVPLASSELRFVTPQLLGAYVRPNSTLAKRLPLSMNQISVIRSAIHVLAAKYFTGLDYAEEDATGDAFRLGLDKLAGLFYAVLGAGALAGLCLVAEAAARVMRQRIVHLHRSSIV